MKIKGLTVIYAKSNVKKTNPNEPKTNPITKRPKMNVTSVTIANYEENRPPTPRKNKPNSNSKRSEDPQGELRRILKPGTQSNPISPENLRFSSLLGKNSQNCCQMSLLPVQYWHRTGIKQNKMVKLPQKDKKPARWHTTLQRIMKGRKLWKESE